MRFATCTPYPFSGEPRFFTRDTGLLCRGMQAAGHDCVVVMPGEKDPNEPDDLIRCSPGQLASAEWWKKSGIDAVILYAWGDPRYLPVASAIRRAGIRLIQSLDTAGLHTPYGGFREWLRVTLDELRIPNPLPTRLRRLARVPRDLLPALYDAKRLEMMAECDHLAAVSPPAAESIRTFALALSRPDVADKIIVLPHPVSPLMIYQGETKRNNLLCVGRWGADDAPQKDPDLTLKVITGFLSKREDWTASIIGPMAGKLKARISTQPSNIRNRIQFEDFIKHDKLRQLYAESRILLCASRFESFHIASAEAVCCGCSVVVPESPLLRSTKWFTENESGTVAISHQTQHIVKAITHEVKLWNTNHRDPFKISESWCNSLHSPRIGMTIGGVLTAFE